MSEQIVKELSYETDTPFGRYLPPIFADGRGEPLGRDASLIPLGQFRTTDYLYGNFLWNYQFQKYMRTPNVSFKTILNFRTLASRCSAKWLLLLQCSPPKGRKLPNVRLVSRKFHPDTDVPDTVATLMVMQFGQFLDHDVTQTPETEEEECCEIGHHNLVRKKMSFNFVNDNL